MIMKNNLIADVLSRYGKANQARVRNKLIIATKISRRLRELGMSQKKFAAKIGKSAPEVSDILSGDRNLTIDTMTDIEVALGINLLDKTLLKVCRPEEVCTISVKATGPFHSYFDSPRYTTLSGSNAASLNNMDDEYLAKCV